MVSMARNLAVALAAVLAYRCVDLIATTLAAVAPGVDWIVATFEPASQPTAYAVWGWGQYLLAALAPALLTALIATGPCRLTPAATAVSSFTALALVQLGWRYYAGGGLGAAVAASLMLVLLFTGLVFVFALLFAARRRSRPAA